MDENYLNSLLKKVEKRELDSLEISSDEMDLKTLGELITGNHRGNERLNKKYETLISNVNEHEINKTLLVLI